MKINKAILCVMLFVFTVSTTGLPLFIHLCNAKQKASLKSCAMCKMQKPIKGVSFSKVRNCCESKALLTPNPEQYLSSNNHQKVLSVINLPAVIPDITINNNQLFTLSTSTVDSSPPGTISNPLYITNSVLLI